jgi:crotonobetainyl-CoA:carnitine CoA-transferase CaiB-like acyl-CoA transferase
MRDTMFADGIERTLDSACFFATINPGKRGFSIDARDPRGRELLESLISQSDMVAESFSAGVMERWGLTYERMTELRPDLIYLSLSGFGHSGRYRFYDTWGPTAQSFNGLTGMSGLPQHPPAGIGFSYMDVIAGYMGALAALMALYHRRRTGEGQYVDIAQVEAGLAFTGPSFLDASVNGHGPGRIGVPPGNRSIWPDGDVALGLRGEVGAPYNCYPTAGGGRFDYCAITVTSEQEWTSLCEVLGFPLWAAEPRYQTMAARIRNQTSLDEHIAAWTVAQEKTALMQRLQAAGVPAGALQSPEELLEADPQLAHRQLFKTATHPLLGERPWTGLPLQLSASPPRLVPQWPLLGEANAYVLQELLGLDAEEVAVLEDSHVTWPKGMPRDISVEKGTW